MPLRSLLLAAILVSTSLQAAAPGVYAITGGKVHRVSGAPLESATVVIRDGLIEAVATNISPPPDAVVVDARGQHVYPGFIDALTSIGLPAPPPRIRAENAPETTSTEAAIELTPSLVVSRLLRLKDETLDERRAVGVTTILVTPTRGIFNGQAVLLNLSSDSAKSGLIRSPAATVVAYNPHTNRTFPDSLMGVVAHLRQTFLDARHYASATELYNRNPTGKRRLEQNADLEALQPAMRREVPVVFIGNSELLISRSLDIAREFNLRPVLAGARQSYDLADQIKSANASVLLSVDFPGPPGNDESDRDLPLRLLRERVLAPTSAAVLDQKGVPFALVSNGASGSAYRDGVRLAVKAGLSEESALRALTLSPAEILGVSKQLGSIDKGKIANVFISEKPFFDEGWKLKSLFVDGRLIRLPKVEEKTSTGDETGQMTWDLVIHTPDGTVNMRIVIRGEGSALTGTYSGDRGSGDIRDILRENDRLQFTIAQQTAPDSETSDWRFDATISGSTISGTIQTSVGTYTFTGSKPQ